MIQPIRYNADDTATVSEAAFLGFRIGAPGIAGDQGEALKGGLPPGLTGTFEWRGRKVELKEGRSEIDL